MLRFQTICVHKNNDCSFLDILKNLMISSHSVKLHLWYMSKIKFLSFNEMFLYSYLNIIDNSNMHLVQVHRNRQTTIRTAISPQPKCRVYLHFGLRREEQRRFVELLANNKISTDAQEENHIAVIHNSDRVLKQERSNEEKKNLQKLMSMYSNGRPMLNTISKLRSESSTPINMWEDSSKISEVKSDSKNLPAIAISPIHNRSQFYPNIWVDDSFNSKSTFNSEAHEHRKKIIEYLIDN